MPFQLPPIDGSVDFPHFIDSFLEKDLGEIYATLAPPSGEGDLIHISWLELVRATHRASHIMSPLVHGRPPTPEGNVIGIYAVMDNLVYIVLILGIIRSGNIPLPMSNRNTAPAIANLLSKTSCHHLIRTMDSATDRIVSDVHRTMDKSHPVNLVPVPLIEKLFPHLGHESSDDPFEPYPAVKYHSQGKTLMYCHSSGSTGFPKPIPLTQRYIFQLMNLPGTDDYESSTVLAAMAAPPSHLQGLFTQIVVPMVRAVRIVLWTPSNPPPVPTPERILASMRMTQCNSIITAPTFMVSWARDPEAVKFLAGMQGVMYGGGPLVQEVGDFLVESGVPLSTVYGGTEFGVPGRIKFVLREAKEWDWTEMIPQMNVKFVPQHGSDTYELQILHSRDVAPLVHNTKTDKGPAYATSDLFVKHPTKDMWKVVGRLDDQVTLSNGAKINPGPIENIVIQDPLVYRVVLFGRAQDQPGLLIEPAPGHTFDPADEEALAEYRNKIWSSVVIANRSSATFARVFKEFILVTHPSKPLPQTQKDTVNRKQAYQLYHSEIEAIYTAASANNSGTSPDSWGEGDLAVWLLNGMRELVGRDIEESADLFEQGADSLTSTYLRNRIISALRRSDSAQVVDTVQRIEPDIIYSHPTILSLASHISHIIYSPLHLLSHPSSAVLKMQAMVERYTASLPPRRSSPFEHTPSPIKQIVLLTGSTGALGSYILAELLADERVERIWAVNRQAQDKSVSERQRESFVDKALDAELLKLEGTKLVFVVANLSEHILGLDADLYNEISSSTTLIIHNAWRLDFNLSLPSFEPHIKGTRNLVDLALYSPNSTRFFFISSVAALNSWKSEEAVLEGPILDPEVSVGLGYGESKYVAEKILEEASERSSVATTTFRVGQLCGGGNGFWAPSDWIPILLTSSRYLGCLPDAIGDVTWLPLHIAARSILDAGVFNAHPTSATFHLRHPCPIPWSTIMDAISDSLHSITGDARLPLVPFHDWFLKLERVALDATPETMQHVPAIKLLPFYREMAVRDKVIRDRESVSGRHYAAGEINMDTQRIRCASETMRNLLPLGADNAERWVAYWGENGVFGKETEH